MKWPSQVVLVVTHPLDSAGDISNMVRSLGWNNPLVHSPLGRSPGGRHSNPLQYSCLENPMERGASRAIVHRVAMSWT